MCNILLYILGYVAVGGAISGVSTTIGRFLEEKDGTPPSKTFWREGDPGPTLSFLLWPLFLVVLLAAYYYDFWAWITQLLIDKYVKSCERQQEARAIREAERAKAKQELELASHSYEEFRLVDTTGRSCVEKTSQLLNTRSTR